MIGKICGIIEEIDGNIGYIDNGYGISYLVYLTPYLITQKGTKISIYTYFDVKQDSQILYGFEEKKQYDIYKQLISVDGVGPKTAYSIVCGSKPDQIYEAVINNNVGYFNQIKGIGIKTAQRIVLELSHLLKKTIDISQFDVNPEDKIVIEALKSLGFDVNDSIQVVRKIDKKETMENKIKMAIKIMTTKKY